MTGLEWLFAAIAIAITAFYSYHYGWMTRHKIDVPEPTYDWE